MGTMYHLDLSNLSPSEKEYYKNKIENNVFEMFPYSEQIDRYQILWDSEEDIYNALQLPRKLLLKKLN